MGALVGRHSADTRRVAAGVTAAAVVAATVTTGAWWWPWRGRPAPTPRPTATPTPTAPPSASPTPTPTTPPSPGSAPLGPGGQWSLKFADDFSGTAVDTGRWNFRSTAEADWSTNPLGTGNPGNEQLEFNRPENCTVTGGNLVIVAKPERVTSSSGKAYTWTSCMLNTSNSYAFQYGYVETRAQLPGVQGFWPALWTWAAPNSKAPASNWETDAFETYTDNQSKVYLTQHNVSPAYQCIVQYKSGAAKDWHVYGVDIRPDGTTWYVDGVKSCETNVTSGGQTNILLDLFVYSKIPPAAGTTGTMTVDYVRAWSR